MAYSKESWKNSGTGSKIKLIEGLKKRPNFTCSPEAVETSQTGVRHCLLSYMGCWREGGGGTSHHILSG